MIYLPLKALSVNKAWKGRRFKTEDYKNFISKAYLMLPKMEVPKSPLCLRIEFGYYNKLSDFDNGIKPFVDILQQKYKFNDRDIKRAIIEVNNDVEKEQDYIGFELTSLGEK